MNKLILLPLLAAAAACSGTTKTQNDMAVAGDMAMVTGDMAMTACTVGPTCAPLLGAQIDRLGRAGVNTAVTDPFWDNGNTGAATAHHAKQDNYNAASNPATWGSVELVPGDATTTVLKTFEASLAVYDSIDGAVSPSPSPNMSTDGCGNQFAFDATVGGTSYPAYSLLATVLADDELYVNTGSGVCSDGGYLAVEVGVVTGVAATDCGGRTPTHNSIDVTYNVFINGLSGMQVSNGITSKASPNGESNTTFPFLGTPN